MTLTFTKVYISNTARFFDVTEFCEDLKYYFIGYFSYDAIAIKRGGFYITGAVDVEKIPEFLKHVQYLKKNNAGGILKEDYDLLLKRYRSWRKEQGARY